MDQFIVVCTSQPQTIMGDFLLWQELIVLYNKQALYYTTLHTGLSTVPIMSSRYPLDRWLGYRI